MQTQSQKTFLWGQPVKVDEPTLETLKKHGQIVSVNGARYAVSSDRGQETLHRFALV